MLIEVTKDDIREGVAADCERCPVALAINRALPPGFLCTVHSPDWLSIYRGEVSVECEIAQPDVPIEVIEWIETFDSGDLCPEPISFDLPIDELCGAAA